MKPLPKRWKDEVISFGDAIWSILIFVAVAGMVYYALTTTFGTEGQ